MILRVFAFLFVLGLVNSSQAFLNDSDPVRFYHLAIKAPWIAVVGLENVQNQIPKKSYSIYRLQVRNVLSGQLEEKKIQILEESIFSKKKPMMNPGETALVFLAPLPRYTAYASAHDQGVRFRFFGGPKGLLLLGDNKSQILDLVRDILSLKGKPSREKLLKQKELLIRMLGMPGSQLQVDGALGLEELDLQPGGFSEAEENTLFSLLESSTLPKKAQIALVVALKKSKSRSILKKIADGPAVPAKWAAIRALEDLGVSRPVQDLGKDFEQSDRAGKFKILSIMAGRNDDPAKRYLNQFLSGPSDFELKREAVLRMGEKGGEENERVLLGQITHRDENVSAEVILALGKMQSSKSVAKIVPYLESPSKRLRDAAIFSLYVNQDPGAQRILGERFTKDSHGHFHPKKHFGEPLKPTTPHQHGPGQGHSQD